MTGKKTLTIRTSGSDITALATALDNDFTKEEIRRILTSLEKLFESYNVLSGTMIVSEKVPALLLKTSSKKAELTAVLSALLISRDVLEAYSAMIPPEAVNIYRWVYHNIFVGLQKAEEKFGKKIVINKNSRGWSYRMYLDKAELIPEFSMLKCEALDSWSNMSLNLVMPPSIRKVLGPILEPSTPAIAGVADYIPGKDETLYSHLQEIEPVYPALHSLYLTGSLEMGKTKVTATTLKRISRQAPFKEFFPESKNKLLKNLAGTLVASLFCLNASNSLAGRKAIPEPVPTVARNLIGFMRNSTGPAIFFYSGLLLSKTYQTLFSISSTSQLIKTCLDTIGTYASENWLTTDGLMAALHNSPDPTTVLIPFNIPQLNNYSIYNLFSGRYISAGLVISQFTRPVVELLVASLAALGLAEIIYSKPQEDSASPMSGLKAMRLTTLGQYALGLTNEYVSQLAEQGPLLEFDSERLLVQTLGENNPYETFLSKYLIPVGEHRFRVTAESFTEGCETRRDLENKIANFRQLTQNSFPPIWEAFFNDLKRKCDSLLPADSAYQILKVNPDDHEVIEVITTDPALREITVCAEGFMLLVKNSDYGKFKEIMQHYGYIV